MNRSPARLNLEHLKKQAKELIRLYRRQAPEAYARFRQALPTAAGRSDAQIAALDLRLHDAQSCVARDLGFASWPDLRRYVEAQLPPGKSRDDRVRRWLQLVYAAEVDGTTDRAHPRVAVRMLTEDPDLVADDPYLACTIGDEETVKRAAADDPAWVNRPGGPLKLPPLVAVTHSSLLQIPEYQARLHRWARLLLQAGADPDQHIGSRWPPESLDAPDDSNPLAADLRAFDVIGPDDSLVPVLDGQGDIRFPKRLKGHFPGGNETQIIYFLGNIVGDLGGEWLGRLLRRHSRGRPGTTDWKQEQKKDRRREKSERHRSKIS